MEKKGLNRRQFLKLTGAVPLVAAAGTIGGGLAFPKGLWAATPKVKGPIKVGYQAVLSGTLAGYGEFHKMGAIMAMEEINAKGGIAGQKVEVEFRDSTTKADEAIKNARYFVDSWGADFLAGIDSSGQALALAPVMAQLDRVLMVTHGATEKLTADFRSHINTIMDAKPDGLYSTEWAGELITFVKQAKEAGLFEKVKYVMFPVGADMDVLDGLGKDMPDNLWISGRYYFQYPNSKENNDWVARFRKRWNHYPAYVSETGYSAIYAFKAAVEKAGSKDTKAVIAALEGMEMNSPAGRRFFRKEDHQAIYDVPWGQTKSDPKYPFKVMGETKVIPAKGYFNRPPFEGPGTSPPFK